MNSHLLALQVVVPLMAAPICVLIRHPLLTRLFTVAVALATLCISWMILSEVQTAAVISYELGGFAPPLGIELRVDHSNSFVLLIVSMIGAVVGVGLMLLGGRGLKTAVPFGPFLAVAAMIYVLHGPELVRHHFPGFAVVFGQ